MTNDAHPRRHPIYSTGVHRVIHQSGYDVACQALFQISASHKVIGFVSAIYITEMINGVESRRSRVQLGFNHDIKVARQLVGDALKEYRKDGWIYGANTPKSSTILREKNGLILHEGNTGPVQPKLRYFKHPSLSVISAHKN